MKTTQDTLQQLIDKKEQVDIEAKDMSFRQKIKYMRSNKRTNITHNGVTIEFNRRHRRSKDEYQADVLSAISQLKVSGIKKVTKILLRDLGFGAAISKWAVDNQPVDSPPS